jgi:hypothetical protein
VAKDASLFHCRLREKPDLGVIWVAQCNAAICFTQKRQKQPVGKDRILQSSFHLCRMPINALQKCHNGIDGGHGDEGPGHDVRLVARAAHGAEVGRDGDLR